jgi:hypothetical protein
MARMLLYLIGMRVANHKPLRAKHLDSNDLRTVEGARGSCCGNSWHCDRCGTVSPIDSYACPGCGFYLYSTSD